MSSTHGYCTSINLPVLMQAIEIQYIWELMAAAQALI